jgi:hypothetical protein
MSTPALILWSAGLIVLFVLITLAELWFIKKLGFDILGHLQIHLTQGKRTQVLFEAFGVVAFIMVQPVLLTWLFSQISGQLAARLLIITESVAAAVTG